MSEPDNTSPFDPYRFDQVDQAPNAPGLYAWYHQIQLSTADVETLAVSLRDLDAIQRAAMAREFLTEHIFGPYQEADYDVELSGKLKPEYRGRLGHRPRLSDLLVRLVADQPLELLKLKTILRGTIPFFASPIYIGVATKSLRQRLSSHRDLIRHYREVEPAAPIHADDEDHSFAYEAICVRRLVPTELLVYAMSLNANDKLAKSAEYILNRINYPLCGRN